MNQNKFYELEALRGIASIIVFFNHFFLGFIPSLHGLFVQGKGLYGTPFYFIINGGASVVFFFVLSGFVLTFKFFSSENITYITKGITKRYFRLAGPVLLTVLCSYVFFKLRLYHYIEAASFTKSLWLDDFAISGRGHTIIPSLKKALTQGTFFCLFRGDSYYNTNLWTLRIEFIGSFISFLLAPVIFNFKKIELIIITPILMLLFHFLNPYYICFFSGTMIAYYRSKKEIVISKTWIKVLLLLFALFLYSYQRPLGCYSFLNLIIPDFLNTSIGIYIHTLSAIIIVILALSGGKTISFMKGKFGKLLGEISFPLYLTHIIIISSFSSFIYIKLIAYFTDSITSVAITFLLTIPVLGIATYIFHIFDKYWVNKINSIVNKF